VENGADVYCFNSRGYWKESDDVLEAIPLQTSLTMQTAILTDQLEWEKWEMLPGAMIPTKASVDKVLPGYYDKYLPGARGNLDKYLATLKDRFQQRRDFLSGSDLTERPQLLEEIVKTLQLNN
jgi:phosphoenolpyruvate carboxykinase (ATP)